MTDKLVNITVYRPFVYNKITFSGRYMKVRVNLDTIRVALENKARVEEIIDDIHTKILTLTNYTEKAELEQKIIEKYNVETDHNKPNPPITKVEKIKDKFSEFEKNISKNNDDQKSDGQSKKSDNDHYHQQNNYIEKKNKK